MRLLADENFPRAVVEALRKAGHDVVRVVDVARGADDRSVERLATADGRAILTFDKDFGDLAVRGRVARSGVVLVRFPPVDVIDTGGIIAAALAEVGEVTGHLVLIERDRVRMRRLPSA